MRETSLRPATAADQAAILATILRERLDPSTLNWRNFIVAVDNGEIVGMAQVKPYSDCREFGSLAVKPSHRNRGIGGQLVQALIEREPSDVYLVCRDVRAPYYRKFGFGQIHLNDAPRTLQWKLRLGQLFKAFGVEIVCMKLKR
jgi:N-acetylglutamate synthase-like GNAT family acetyltransferase